MKEDSQENIERDVQKICFGGKFVTVEDGLGTPHLIILRPPSLKDKVFIDYLYEKALKEAKDRGLLSEVELRLTYNRKGIWTEKHSDDVKRLSTRVRTLKKDINEAQRAREKRVLGRTLESAEGRLETLLRLKHSLLGLAAERHADEVRHNALVFACVFDEEDNKVWQTWSDFGQERDFVFIKNISNTLATSDVEIGGKRIREIARCADWRFKWAAGKRSDELFGKPIIELDVQQQALVYWSQVYDSVYESMDRPDDSIIDDDDKLDEWFKNQERKRKVESVEDGKQMGGIKLSNNISRHGEIFIVANSNLNPDAPMINEIEDLNDSFVKKFKKSETEKVKRHGSVNEKDLRQRGNTIARKLIGSNAAVLGKGSLAGKSRGGKGASKMLPGHMI